MHPPRLPRLACLAAACSGFLLHASAAPELPGVGAAMQRTVDAHEIAGAVTLVATRDGVVHLEATGLANVAEGKPMAVDSLFWIASMTKPVTSVAILMLQDQGKLKVGDLVEKYLPEFAALKTPSGRPAHLTIAQLLTHTSGVAEAPRSASRPMEHIAELVPLAVDAPMQYEPGTRWKYTSAGFNLAGLIVQRVSGEPFDEFLRRNLFAPLGMPDTTFVPTAEQRTRLVSCYSKSRGTGALSLQAAPPATVSRGNVPFGAGGLYSTASDMGRFYQMLLGRGVLGGRRYLSEAAYATLTTLQTGELKTGFSASQINDVLGWGTGVYLVRHPHAGVTAVLSPGTFGHPGAWGTHGLVDPVKGRVYVLMIQRSNLPDNFENEPTRAFVEAADAALAGSAH